MNAAGAGALRLFVAAEIPAEALRAIKEWQEASLARQEGVRLNHALHITLAFLGEISGDRVDDLVTALQKVPVEPCPVGVSEALFLPERGPKRVVALALKDPSGGLAALQSGVARSLAATGLFEVPRRPWLAHLTVARFRRPGHPFSLQNVNIPEFCVVRTVLYSSLLERAGAVHTPLAVSPAS